MSKIFKNAAIIIIALLLLQTTCYAKAMSPTEDGTSLEETINVETLEKDQLLTLVKGKVYILSYPVVSSDWIISEIRVQVENVGWLTIGEGEESSYLRLEECEAEQGRVAFKIICKTECITAIRVSIWNEQTEETQEYALKVKVQKLAEDDTDENWWIVIPVEPNNPDEDEKLIVIDTSGWVLDRNWMETDIINGTLKIKMPSWVDSTGAVKCTYEVNGVEVGSNYTITDTGIYSVSVKFDLAEGMEEKYIISNNTASAIYQVETSQFSQQPKYNLHMNELENLNEGQVGVCVWFENVDSTFSSSGISWYLRYDTDVLMLNKDASSKGPSISWATSNPYVEGDDNTGRCNTLGSYYTNSVLQNLVFDVKDGANTDDMIINITRIEASGNPMAGNPTEYTNGYGIVLNQVSNIIGVTLPEPQSAAKNSITPEQEEASSDDMQTEHNLDEEVSEEFDDEVTEEIEENSSEKQTDEQEVETTDTQLDEKIETNETEE